MGRKRVDAEGVQRRNGDSSTGRKSVARSSP
jgi:hypothetical protein